MLCLATNDAPKIKVSRIELEAPEKPYTIETLTRLKSELKNTRIFFVMGADSWDEITTWREWETVLTIVNIIVVTRPGYEIEFSRVCGDIRERIVDARGRMQFDLQSEDKIYITDAVQIDVSATEIRESVRRNETDWRENVPESVARYIEKYGIY